MKGLIWNYFHASNPNDDGYKIEDKIPCGTQSFSLSLPVSLTRSTVSACQSTQLYLDALVSKLAWAPKTHVISTLTFRTHDYGKTHGVYKRGLNSRNNNLAQSDGRAIVSQFFSPSRGVSLMTCKVLIPQYPPPVAILDTS